MNELQRLRYQRHILLPELGVCGQERIINARVLLIGLGGLGSAVAMYLTAAGIGQLILSDYDLVDLSNLQRQIIHRYRDLGRLKVESARDALIALNSEIELKLIARALEEEELCAEMQHCDLVIDASDNFETRFTINRACYRMGVPLVSGAAMGMNGQVAVFPHNGIAPCYNCLYHDDDDSRDETCVSQGVFAPLVGIIGTLQASEAIKLIAGIGEPLSGKLLLINAASMEWRTLTLNRDYACPTCGVEN